MPFSRVCTEAGGNRVQEIESVSFVKQKKQNTNVFIKKGNFLSKIYTAACFVFSVLEIDASSTIWLYFSLNKVKAMENKFIFDQK